MSDSDPVWYVAYGSNLLYERFAEYLAACSDPAPPRAERRMTIPYARYFARDRSERWGEGGVAFLDPDAPGEALGRAYLVTGQQFAEVQAAEGAWYTRRVDLDPIDGLPAATFTGAERLPDNPPGLGYRCVVERGEDETRRLA